MSGIDVKTFGAAKKYAEMLALGGKGLQETVETKVNEYLAKDGTMDSVDLLNNVTMILFNDGVYPIELFGGKANDNTVDNSVALALAINTLKKKGGTIRFKNANYYFSTPIVISDSRAENIIIEGQGIADISTGKCTQFIYTGEGNFFTSEVQLWSCHFKNFQLTLNENSYGFNFIGSFYCSTMKNVRIKNGIGKIKMQSGAYSTLENVFTSADTSDNVTPTTEYDLLIGGSDDTSVVLEFIYVRNCAFANSCTGDSVIVENSNNIYFDEVDICAHKYSTGLYIHARTKKMMSSLYFTNMNIINCKNSIIVDAENNFIQHSYITNPEIIMLGESTDEHVIQYINHDSENSYHSSFDITGISLRTIGTTIPQYFFECTVKNKGMTRLDFLQNLTKCTLYDTGSTYSYVPCNFPWLKLNKRVEITTDGTSKEYSITITDNSPFKNYPLFNIVVQNISSGKLTIPQYRANIVNTFAGEMKVKIVFAEPIAAGTIEVIYTCNPCLNVGIK